MSVSVCGGVRGCPSLCLRATRHGGEEAGQGPVTAQEDIVWVQRAPPWAFIGFSALLSIKPTLKSECSNLRLQWFLEQMLQVTRDHVAFGRPWILLHSSGFKNTTPR